jgi:hypothetical protein
MTDAEINLKEALLNLEEANSHYERLQRTVGPDANAVSNEEMEIAHREVERKTLEVERTKNHIEREGKVESTVTESDLVKTLQQVADMLTKNRAAATPDMLKQVESVVQLLRQQSALRVMVSGMGVNVDSLLTSVENALLMEHMLVDVDPQHGDLTTRLVSTLTKLQSHPIILGMVSKLL